MDMNKQRIISVIMAGTLSECIEPLIEHELHDKPADDMDCNLVDVLIELDHLLAISTEMLDKKIS